MNVILTKEIVLKSATVYLKLQRKVKREDIQKYLQGNHFDNPIVENRVRDYLKNIRIYNEQYHLTDYGREVKETGMVNLWEEGKYKIYFTQSDSYFGNRIFFLQRQQPQPTRNSPSDFEQFSIDEKGHFCLLSNKDDSFRFDLDLKKPVQNYAGIETSDVTSLTFYWKWKELESSVYTFRGRIESNNIADKAEFESNEELNEKIAEILHPDWDSDNARYKISFESVNNDNEHVSFEYTYNSKWKDFDVHIDKLPIEPYNHEDAYLWRNYLLDIELSEDYLNPKDFENAVRDLNQKEGFVAYRASLDVPTEKEYLKKISPSVVSKRGLPYWHLAAPLDLNPGIPKAMIKRSFSYHKGQEISFQEIAQNIHGDTAKKIFYYDKYVITQKQQEYLSVFFESFPCNKAYLITDTAKENRSDYIEKYHNHIAQKNMNDIFKNKPQHDRYFIISVDTELKVWNVSNSFDYIQFDENTVSADTKGKIEQSVTFTNVEEKMLFPELLQFIKEEAKNV